MIQRYDLEYESEDVGTPMVMEPADDGDYVTFDDHESEVAALRAEVERIEDSIHEANEAREDAERERDALRAEVARLTAVRDAAAAIDWSEALTFEGGLDAHLFLSVDQLNAIKAALEAARG